MAEEMQTSGIVLLTHICALTLLECSFSAQLMPTDNALTFDQSLVLLLNL